MSSSTPSPSGPSPAVCRTLIWVSASSSSGVVYAGPAPPARELAARHVLSLVSKGSVELQGVTIRGTLDLRPLGTVEHRLECRSCRLEGNLVGFGVVFARTLDLSGSQITGAVKMQGAEFREPVLLGSPPASSATQFEGKVDFSLAKFDDFVTFEGAGHQAYLSVDAVLWKETVSKFLDEWTAGE